MRIHKKNVVILIAFVAFIWIMNSTLTSYNPDSRSPNELKGDIVKLSENYVRKLARQTHDAVDGPFADGLTGYDMKKTMAVLLDDLIGRINVLESEVKQLKQNRTNGKPNIIEQKGEASRIDFGPQYKDEAKIKNVWDDQLDVLKGHGVDMRALIMGAQEDCSISAAEKIGYPHCEEKMTWMREHWTVDPCYAEYGVDGRDCSIRVFLSEVENWCPLIAGRQPITPRNKTVANLEPAEMQFELHELLKKLANPGDRPNYDWIRQRIQGMWPGWVVAGRQLKEGLAGKTAPKRTVLVHLGLLSKKSGFKMAENSMKGGPLGELVQWSDIISALYMLGHDLTITSEFEELSGKLDRLPTANSLCQIRSRLPMDMIVTDIVGLTQFKRKVRAGYGKFSCLLRIIDSFGTEPAFNYEPFAKAHRLRTPWGMQNLNPQQFYTMFPHSPDNSFMGFVVEKHVNSSQEEPTRRNQAVVYGKAAYMWAGKDTYLDVFHDFLEVHATVFLEEEDRPSVIPSYVKNHGIMTGPQLHALLQQSKLFIGMGFPYEGPAPLEAMALGNVFINPRFDPPHNKQNSKFFSDKPTFRQLTSQHQYAEDFIGEPHVITVNMDDPHAVRQAIQQALNFFDEGAGSDLYVFGVFSKEVSKDHVVGSVDFTMTCTFRPRIKVFPFLPFEYTQQGMLQRLSYYITKQDFCEASTEPWVPDHAVSFIAGMAGESCKDACFREGRICEPSHFPRLNHAERLESHLSISCGLTTYHDHIYYPAFRDEDNECMLQKEPMLFSCVGDDPTLRRICPCRTYINGQTAICEDCL